MKVLRYAEPGKAEIVEVPTPKIESNQALARSIACNVSAGTELSFYRGTAPQINYRIGPHGLWYEAVDNMTYPMQSDAPGCWFMGYGNVSEIIEVGSEVVDLKVGDIVFSCQGHKDHQVISSNCHKLPEGMKPEHGSFTMLADICFNGILDSHIKLMDSVIIFGMGTLGQLLLQMAKLSGAFVIAVDYIDKRLQLASRLGADAVINPKTESDVAGNVIKVLGGGADIVLEVSGNSDALSDAVRCVRKDGQVTVMSFYQKPPATFQMGHEFHHKRIIIRSSQVGGIDPCISHQYDRTKRAATALNLIEKLDVESLISHRCSFDEYPEALKIIDKNPSECQSVIIKY